MRFNRSAPHARVVPVLTVSDVRAAVAWYGRTFGFVEYVKIGAGHRAQLGLPGEAAELIVAEVRPGRRLPTADRSHQILLKVEDVAATLATATANGATVADELRDHPYGERQAGLNDPFGHQWMLTQTLVDTAPEDWGGETMRARSKSEDSTHRGRPESQTPPPR
jgi:PhnB protein